MDPEQVGFNEIRPMAVTGPDGVLRDIVVRARGVGVHRAGHRFDGGFRTQSGH